MASQPISIPSNTTVIPVNVSSTSKTFTLPVISTNAGRVLIFKDLYGNSANSTIKLSTIGLDRIELSNVSSMVLSQRFGAWTFMNDGISKWFLTDVYKNTLVVIAPPGLIGVFHLAPTGTFPAFTGTSPTFGPSFVTFNPAASQYIDFGPRVFNLGTLGFSLKTKIVWNSYNNWSRVIDFNSGGNGNQDMFLTLPGTGSSPLRFQYKENGSEQVTDWGGTISLNTIYTIAVVYNPNAGGANGQTKIFVNGALVVTNNSMGAKGTDKNYAFTYVGRSSYGADAYLGVSIYSLDIFNLAITDAEALS